MGARDSIRFFEKRKEVPLAVKTAIRSILAWVLFKVITDLLQICGEGRVGEPRPCPAACPGGAEIPPYDTEKVAVRWITKKATE